jgi:hypothetical protein
MPPDNRWRNSVLLLFVALVFPVALPAICFP